MAPSLTVLDVPDESANLVGEIYIGPCSDRMHLNPWPLLAHVINHTAHHGTGVVDRKRRTPD